MTEATGTALDPPDTTAGSFSVTNSVKTKQALRLGTGTGGTFTLAFRGRSVTFNETPNPTVAAIQAGLRALDLPPKDSIADVVCTGSTGIIDIYFDGRFGLAELLTVTDATTGGAGTGANVTIAYTGTTGAKGSVSIAYTEKHGGAGSVSVEVEDNVRVTGGNTGPTNRQKAEDAASPVVFSGLRPGSYTAVLRTIIGGRVSKPATGTFSVT